MSGTTLSLRTAPAGRIDMTGVLPEILAGRTAAEIEKMPLRVDGVPVALGECFAVTAGEGEALTIRPEGARLDGLGRDMRTGMLRVEGAAGHYLAQGMRGGELIVDGDAGDCAANGMRGGCLRIAGNAGDWLAAALIGDRAGMGGGVVAVGGNAGDRLGDRMRRGLVLVRGRAGTACGARMRAGTLVVAGGCGTLAGFGLRRGSLILGQAPEAMPACHGDAGIVTLAWLGLLRRHAEAILPGAMPDTSRMHRYMGDLAFGGKGEILVP
ncbi:formylmethanofuran dehydrogenase subunit C [Betaproteobacteria bacterium SCN1]|jgi:formylmethanofuran dehydrogenase subunit C|nr:formylmethanofuran dehydrogenase subunit C [Betaproteobacteria bacterium SCN1]